MEKLDILEYLKHTPENTNPVILNQLITEYGEEHKTEGVTYNVILKYDYDNYQIKSNKTIREICDAFKSGLAVIFHDPDNNYLYQLIMIYSVIYDNTDKCLDCSSERFEMRYEGHKFYVGNYAFNSNNVDVPLIFNYEEEE